MTPSATHPFKTNISANFDKAAKLCKASKDAYTHGGLIDLLNKEVLEGDASDPHDFSLHSRLTFKKTLVRSGERGQAK